MDSSGWVSVEQDLDGNIATSAGGSMDDAGALSGSIEDGSRRNQIDATLDEPVWQTLKRDLMAICKKFYYVFLPHESRTLLRDWDLWGPMMLTMVLAFLLRSSAEAEEQSQVFAGVFFIICVGACVITLNNQLLGGTLSFFQGLCVLGYCMLPLVMACILLRFVRALTSHIAVRLIFVAAAFGWSVFASVGFLAGTSPRHRRALVVYPIVLFYFVLSWLILNDTPSTTGQPAASTTTTTTTTTTSAAGR